MSVKNIFEFQKGSFTYDVQHLGGGGLRFCDTFIQKKKILMDVIKE